MEVKLGSSAACFIERREVEDIGRFKALGGACFGRVVGIMRREVRRRTLLRVFIVAVCVGLKMSPTVRYRILAMLKVELSKRIATEL